MLSLRGQGSVKTDALTQNAKPPYARRFSLAANNGVPELVADAELPDWSLLGWRGPLRFSLDLPSVRDWRRWLPQDFDEVDGWINRLTG
jgi:hypothetical protein